jgi:trafficking protein particle complex subunit 13
VKTKVHSSKSPSALLSIVERDKIFLEVHIQNLTQDAICFERMSLECTDGWAMVDGNMLHVGDDEQSIFSGSMALMQPQDIRQYIYILTPKSIELLPTVHVPGSIIHLGRLDISWKSSFGEPGRLLTSMLSRRIPPLPAPQPASALPPYLKRSLATSTPSRPHSPQLLSQSRPGTPPGQRPGSPMSGRPTPVAAIMPQSPSQTLVTPSMVPELEAQLFIRQSPGRSVLVEKPFSISFGVVLSTTIPSGKEGLRRKVALAVQYTSPRTPPALGASTVNIEAAPSVLSPGISTPASAAATFNYPLPHQKILAASSRPLTTEAVSQDTNNPGHSQTVFPPPYFEEEANRKVSLSSRVVPVGPSLLFLPSVELGLSSHQGEGLSKAQLVQEFKMTFVALQRGLSTVGGVRILLVDDDLDEGENKRMKSQTQARVLKEYDVVGELWVSASQSSS